MSRSVSFKGPFIHKIMIRLGEFMLVIAECLLWGGGSNKRMGDVDKGQKGDK